MTIPEVPLPVSVDSFKLAKALMEILKNAHEAMSGVTDRPSLIRIAASAKRSSTISQPYVQLEISDNGPGISDEVKQSLFDPFVSTKNDGTGLGLAIAKKLIDAHGGRLEADDNPGGGARFVIRIPMLDRSPDLN
jgi:signal transduction histidine kinase